MELNVFSKAAGSEQMSWMEELQKNIHTIDDLKQYIAIPASQESELRQIVDLHPMSVTRYYMSLINKEDPNDPIMKMVIPSTYELDQDGSYDTSGELSNTITDGLQHKYKNTALITITNQCSAYCRYCFRKRMVGLPDEQVKLKIHEVAKYIQENPSINNALVSGGDPFILNNDMIRYILDELSGIESLDFIRFGSKIPVVFPQRILEDDQLVELLSEYTDKRIQLYVVTHFNHSREITPQSIEAIRCLRKAGLVINNQTVLMKGINDQPEILKSLLKGLVKIGVNPYYVFQCRPVKRVKNNFQLSLLDGYRVVEEARAGLDGHTKRFKYVMSHVTGKVEIVGPMNGDMIFKYHQAKNPDNLGKIFKHPVDEKTAWLDDLE
jgi:lysine 2,3-aminomutase